MQLHIPDMVWAIINFLVLVAILNRFLYKPLLGMLEKRKEEIINNMENAKAAEAEAMNLREEYRKTIQQSRQEAQEILDRAAMLGNETKDRIIEQAEVEANKMAVKAMDTIRLEKEEALAQLREEAASLVVGAAGKIIEKTITKEDHEKLIRNFIQEVGDVS